MGERTICDAEKPVIKFGEKGKRKEKTGKVVLAPVNEKRLLYTKKIVKPDFSFTGLCPFINECSSIIKLYPVFFFKFLLSIWEVSKVNALIQQKQLLANQTQSLRSVQNTFCFNRETLPFLLCPGVIVCITDIIFWRFSGDRRQAPSERGALPPSLVSLSPRPFSACLSWPKKDEINIAGHAGYS